MIGWKVSGKDHIRVNAHIRVNTQRHSRNSGGRKQKDAEKRKGVKEEPLGRGN